MSFGVGLVFLAPPAMFSPWLHPPKYWSFPLVWPPTSGCSGSDAACAGLLGALVPPQCPSSADPTRGPAGAASPGMLPTRSSAVARLGARGMPSSSCCRYLSLPRAPLGAWMWLCLARGAAEHVGVSGEEGLRWAADAGPLFPPQPLPKLPRSSFC